MGDHHVEEFDRHKSQLFMKAVLDDLRALAFMLENNLVESGIRRLGAEQEMFLVDSDLRPAPLSLEVLKKANDDRLTTEIARFNLEAPYGRTCCFPESCRRCDRLILLSITSPRLRVTTN